MRDSIIREIRRFGRDRTLLIMTIIIPVALAVLYVVMFAAGTAYNLPIAVVDQDNSSTSRKLTNMIASSPTTFVAQKSGSVAEARAQMAAGEIDAIVYIPQNFEKGLLGTSGTQVAVWLDGTFITKSSLIERDLKTLLQGFNIGVSSQILTSQGLTPAQAYSASYPIVIEKHILYNPYSSYAYYLLPGLMPLVLIIMVSLTTAYVVGSEFRYGTAAQWLQTASGSISRALVAKLSPYLLIFVIISLFMSTLLYRFLGLPLEADSVVMLMLGSLFLILAYMSLSVMFVAITGNMRFALSVCAAYTIAAFSFAGLTFPHIAMYPLISAAANIFPMTFYLDMFIEMGIKGAPLARSLGDLAALGGFILLGMCFVGVLRRKALDSKYYGGL